MGQQWLAKFADQPHEPKNIHIAIQEQGQKKETQQFPEKNELPEK